MKTKNIRKICSAVYMTIALLLFSGCSQDKIANNTENGYLSKKTYQKTLTSWLKPYRIDVTQGNIITSDMLDKLSVGMTKQQTRHLLGSSILTNNFNQDRWIYAFSNAEAGSITKEQTLILSFKDNKLIDIKENTIVN